MITCKHCNSSCIKYGLQKNGQQRYKCKNCGKTQQGSYLKQAYNIKDINVWVTGLVKESCGVRSKAQLLKLAINTIMRRIRQVAAGIKKPAVVLKQQSVEVDELRTFVGTKRNEYWMAYALNRHTYQKLIPKSIHTRGSRSTNHIERSNLNLRTHLKRLSRRTICFSRSAVMLNACLRIYFWHKG